MRRDLDTQPLATPVVQYERSVEVAGSPQVSLDLLRDAVTSRGFRLESVSGRSFEARGPGLSGIKQDPLLGLSWVRASAAPSGLRLEAELGGAERLRRWLIWLIAGLEALFIVGFGIVWLALPELRRIPVLWVVVVAPLIPSVFFLPFLAGLIRRSTLAAADTLLHNVAAEAQLQAENEGEE